MARQTDNSGEKKLFQIKMDPGFKEKLRVESAKAGTDMSQYVRDTLRKRWNSTTSPSKDPNEKTNPPEPSGDSAGSDNGNEPDNSDGVYIEDSDANDPDTLNQEGSDSESSESGVSA